MADDISYWRSIVLEQLKVLLDASPSYNSEQTQAHLDAVNTRIIEADTLGPRPKSAVAPWRSYLTDDHSPIEYSLSIKKDACTIRFAFEPLSSESGTYSDPVNHCAPTQWLSQHRENHDDLTWFDTLSKFLIINASQHSPISPSACGLTQHIFGFDLVKQPMLKSYIFHDAIGRQSSSSSTDWGRQKDAKLAEALNAIGVGQPWQKVALYLDRLRASRPDLAGQAEFIGWDAVDPNVARMKVYVRFSKADLPQLLSHLDLGGALDITKQHTREIKAAATEMWNVLAREDGDVNIVTNDLQGCEPRTRGVILYYELRQGEPDPIPKFYLPVRHYFSSDLKIAERFDDFLARKQLRQSGWYLYLLRRYCNHRDLDSRSGLQTMLGCAIRNGEWELSMYLSAEVFAPERWSREVTISSREIATIPFCWTRALDHFQSTCLQRITSLCGVFKAATHLFGY